MLIKFMNQIFKTPDTAGLGLEIRPFKVKVYKMSTVLRSSLGEQKL